MNRKTSNAWLILVAANMNALLLKYLTALLHIKQGLSNSYSIQLKLHLSASIGLVLRTEILF